MLRLGKTLLLFLFASSLFFSIASAAIDPAPTATSNTDFTGYAKFIYPFVISVGAILAVIMLIIAGLQMMTASEGQRTAAKERIQNALLGLLLLVGVYLILKTINPALLNLQIDTSGLKVDKTTGAEQNSSPTGDCVVAGKTFELTKTQCNAQKGTFSCK